MEKKKLILATGAAVVLLAGGSYLALKANEFSKQNTVNNGTQTNGGNTNNTNNNAGSQSSEPSVTIISPKEGASLSGNRTLSGTTKNSGGKLYYEVSGQEGGVLSEGTVNLEDDSKAAKNFSVEISFSKKPVAGDVGVIRILDADKKEIKSIGVTF